MKMSTELFATLQKSFNTLSKDSVDNYINAYETGKFPRSELRGYPPQPENQHPRLVTVYGSERNFSKYIDVKK